MSDRAADVRLVAEHVRALTAFFTGVANAGEVSRQGKALHDAACRILEEPPDASPTLRAFFSEVQAPCAMCSTKPLHPSWRWAGDHWQHKCPSLDPNVGHVPMTEAPAAPERPAGAALRLRLLAEAIGAAWERDGYRSMCTPHLVRVAAGVVLAEAELYARLAGAVQGDLSAIDLLGAFTPRPLCDVLDKLATWAGHTLDVHDCDCLGYEELQANIPSARHYATIARRMLERARGSK